MTSRHLLLVSLVAIAACRKGAADPDKAGEAEKPQSVVGARTAVATMQPFSETVDGIGTVTPRPGSFALLSAPAPSRVARILVAAGDHVRQGQPLVELDRAPFDADAGRADAARTAAQRTYDRVVRLADAGIAPRKDVDQAASDLAQAQAAWVTARRTQRLATLRSPVNGVVSRMSAVLQGSVDPAQPLVEVVDPAALEVVLSLSPRDAAAVRPGASTAFTSGQDASGEPLGTGTVTSVGAAVDSTARSVPVRVRVTSPARSLRIGESVYGRVQLGARGNALVIPTEALVPDGEGYKVFVVDASGVAHSQPVSVGVRTEKLAEITKGLTAGQTVVTYGAYGVEDSAKIVLTKP